MAKFALGDLDVLQLDVHGVGVDIEAPGEKLRAALIDDYGMFASAELREPALRIVVTEQDVPGTVGIDGGAGDAVLLGPGVIEVRGPNVLTRKAYLKEIRPYLTSTVIALLRRDHGVVNIHASAVQGRKQGVVFAGEKMAGKTSLVLAMVSAGYGYLSNDITLLIPDDGGVLVGGMPQALPVCTGTQLWFATHVPEFGIEPPRDVPVGLDAEELYWFEGRSKLRVGWEQITNRSGLGLRTGLGHLVFPEAAMDRDHPRLRHLDADEAATRLIQNVDYFLKWGTGPQMPFTGLIERTARMVESATEAASAVHFQWCPDHRRNVELLRELVGPPPREL